jgi:hypothetical protein
VSTVPEPDGARLVDRPEVLELVRAVIHGQKTPEEGAYMLAGFWLPRPDDPSSSYICVDDDSLESMNAQAAGLAAAGDLQLALRYAEMNWLLSKRLVDRREMVIAAATLAQLLAGDASALDRRLALLEFCVPEVLQWPTTDEGRAAHMLGFLADARYQSAGGDPRRLRRATEALETALERESHLSQALLLNLVRIAGVAYHDLGESEDDLRRSIYWNVRFLNLSVHDGTRTFAVAAHNLGNAYLALGSLNHDCELLKKAAVCYEMALDTPEGAPSSFTESNKDRAERLIRDIEAGVASEGTVGPDERVARRVQQSLQAGDFISVQSATDGSNRLAQLHGAARHWLEALTLVGLDGPSQTRAEVLYRLATPFITSDQTDGAWTGLCLATAARRLAVTWRPISIARLEAHRAAMLVVIGADSSEAYLREAETLLLRALPVLEAEGGDEECRIASRYLWACHELMG